MLNLEKLDIRDERVQEFLWRYLVPSDFRHDYTRLDAIKEVERQVYAGTCQLWGDMEANFMSRVVSPNPKTIEPHLMGNALVLRTAIKQAIPLAWQHGFEVIRVWTQHENIARIVEKCGFKPEARLAKTLMGRDGSLSDVFTLTVTRGATWLTDS